MLGSILMRSENKYEVLKSLKSLILKENPLYYRIGIQNKHRKMCLCGMWIILS